MTANDSAGSLPSDIVRLLEENMYAYMAYLPNKRSEMDPDKPPVRSHEMKFVQLSGVWLIDGGVPSATFNFVCHSRLGQAAGEPSTPKAAIAAATAYFLSRGRPVGWWTGPSCTPQNLGALLVDSGYSHGGLYPGMAVTLPTLTVPDSTNPEAAERSRASLYHIRMVETMDELSAFAQIAGEVFDGEAQSAIQYYQRAADILLTPGSPFRLYLAYLEDEPIATSIGFLHDTTIGVYSVATLPKARHRGVGRALTSHVLREGHQGGAQYGILQASAQGYRMYESIGFKRCCDFHLYSPPSVTH